MRYVAWSLAVAAAVIVGCASVQKVPEGGGEIERVIFPLEMPGDVRVCVETEIGTPCMHLSEMRRQWRGIELTEE